MNLWHNLYLAERPRHVPLGWDWLVARTALCFKPRPHSSSLLRDARRVLATEDEFMSLDDASLRLRLAEFKVLFRLNRDTPHERILALGAVREAAFRARGERAYLTQIAGALGLLSGCIVEMATGEGKTLTASLAATLEGWRGKGCHVVTSNDYLAARDAELMAPLYDFCGVRVGVVSQDCPREERMAGYACDVTYLTSKEATADYLRDRMAMGGCSTLVGALAATLAGTPVPELLQRGLASAIVDEADSVLCDGGSTPLIISGEPGEARTDIYLAASELADAMELGRDYRLNLAFREVQLTDQGRATVFAAVADADSVFRSRNRACEVVLQALEARHFFHASVQYVVHDGKVVIVDEATGRPMPDHEWRDGIHQAVSAKEGLAVQAPRVTCAQATFQEFFLRYTRLSGMTGTAWEARAEFLQFYGLFVARIPTNKPCLRRESRRQVWALGEEKVRDVVAETLRMREDGHPVLIGTRSIEGSESIARALSGVALSHEVLNAVLHQREADIVAMAGRGGAVTVATNMAGRGTDIKLDVDAAEHGLHVILTERHASIRVDRQLRGRCARQGDPGTTADIISLEDSLFELVPRKALVALGMILASSFGQWLAWRLAAWCQWSGDRKAFRQRKQLLKSCKEFDLLISYAGNKR